MTEKDQKPLNMDMGAGMPVDQRVLDVMLPYFTDIYGNPSSMHFYGMEPKFALQDARQHVAKLINANSMNEIVFTSGATESNNLAIKGVASRNAKKGKHIISTNIEHWAVHTPLKYLERMGYTITRIPVKKNGIVDPADIEKAIQPDTILITVMYANNEIGTIQPIHEISKIAKAHKITLHVDGTSAVGKIPVDVQKDDIDMLTISSNNIYGPKGIGALYVKRGIRIEPIIHGGGQEFGFRSGSENIPGIAGLGKAAEIALEELEETEKHILALREKLIDGLQSNIPDSHLNGDREKRLPNIVSIRFSFVEGEAMVLGLSAVGIAVSSGSACSSKTLQPSHVLLALDLLHEEAHGTLQFNIGKDSTEEDILRVVKEVAPVIERLRRMSPLTPKGYFNEEGGE